MTACLIGMEFRPVWVLAAGYVFFLFLPLGSRASIVTVLLGIAGALLAGWIGHQVGWYKENEGAGFVAAIVGAFLLLLIYRIIAGRRRA